MTKATTGQARHEIEGAAADAVRTIAAAAEAAAKVVAASAASAASLKTADGVSDHDAILKLTTSFDNFKEQDAKDKLLIRQDIQKLADGLVNRTDILEKRVEGCFTKFEFGTFMTENHAPVLAAIDCNVKRINTLENSKIRQNVLMSIGIGLLTILTGIIITHVVK